jgi:hypothetical protein
VVEVLFCTQTLLGNPALHGAGVVGVHAPTEPTQNPSAPHAAVPPHADVLVPHMIRH